MAEKIASLFAEIGADTTKLKSSLTGVKGDLTKFGQGLNDAVKRTTGLDIASLSVAGAIAGVAVAMKKSIDATMEYGKTVGDFSRSVGVSAEESSKLIQMADDLRIDVGTLTMGFKAALKEGVAPNIDGLKDLARQYQALKSPVDKAQFSMKYFGRAGLELNKILEQTPDQIDAMAASAEAAGLVMSEKDVQATKDYWLALDELGDRVEGVKTKIGMGLIPVLLDFAEGTGNAITRIDELNSTSAILDEAQKAGIVTQKERIALGLQSIRGTIDLNYVEKLAIQIEKQLTEGRYEAVIAAGKMKGANEDLATGAYSAGAAFDDLRSRTKNLNDGAMEYAGLVDQIAEKTVLSAGLSGSLSDAYEEYNDSLLDINEQHAQLLSDLSEAEEKYGANSEQVGAIKKDLEGLVGAEQDAAAALRETTNQMIYQQASAGLSAAASMELARSLGLISESDYAVSKTISNLSKEYDAMDGKVDGVIGKTDEFNTKVLEASEVVGALQDQNLPLTMENIAGAMKAVDQVGLGALSPDNLPLVLESIAANEQPAVDAMTNIQTEAEGIGTSITAAADVADTEYEQMNKAADTSVTHVTGVITKVGELQSALNLLPSEKTITITLNTVDTGGGGASGTAHKPRAAGGPVRAGGLYLVGENGPELFIPNASGQIAPSSSGGAAVAMGGAADIYVVQNFYDQGAAALGMAYIESLRGKRLDASMGR